MLSNFPANVECHSDNTVTAQWSKNKLKTDTDRALCAGCDSSSDTAGVKPSETD